MLQQEHPVELASSDYLIRMSTISSAVIPEGTVAKKGFKTTWPILSGIALAQIEIPVGKWRAPHYHTNTPEVAVIIKGTARAGLITPENKELIIDLEEGDCVFFPIGWPHWLRNSGNTDVQAYFNYGHEFPITVEVAHLLAHLNHKEHFLTGGFKKFSLKT